MLGRRAPVGARVGIDRQESRYVPGDSGTVGTLKWEYKGAVHVQARDGRREGERPAGKAPVHARIQATDPPGDRPASWRGEGRRWGDPQARRPVCEPGRLLALEPRRGHRQGPA